MQDFYSTPASPDMTMRRSPVAGASAVERPATPRLNRECRVALYRHVREGSFEPHDIARMTAAYEAALKLLHLKDRAASHTATCPKCRRGMVHVAVTLHPIVPGMQRNTFVCYACNQN